MRARKDAYFHLLLQTWCSSHSKLLSLLIRSCHFAVPCDHICFSLVTVTLLSTYKFSNSLLKVNSSLLSQWSLLSNAQYRESCTNPIQTMYFSAPRDSINNSGIVPSRSIQFDRQQKQNITNLVLLCRSVMKRKVEKLWKHTEWVCGLDIGNNRRVSESLGSEPGVWYVERKMKGPG